MPHFKDVATINIHFQPFQLYPDLPTGNHEGIDKQGWREDMASWKWPDKTADELQARRQALKDAWEKEGLELNFSGPTLQPQGKVGNSMDAQRLIMLARDQGREDAMIEAIYTANHVQNQCLSDWSVLTAAAAQAGVTGVDDMLRSDYGKAEHAAMVKHYRDIGINAVPVIVIDNKYPIFGCPETETIVEVFTQLVQTGTVSKI